MSETHATPSEDEALTGVRLIRHTVRTLTDRPGVYRMLSDEGKVLYVGKAKNLKKRVTNYTHLNRLPARLQRMVLSTHAMEFVVTTTEGEALLVEANFIKQFQPRYNILLRDDKSYPFIRITSGHAFPRISKYRGQRKPGSDYYGPFASAAAVQQALTILQKAFLLRPCNDSMFESRQRPCLQYQIKRCSAPCVDYIDRTAYGELVQMAEEFLTGKSQDVQKALSQRMEAASEALEFEEAAQLRNRIRALTTIQSGQRLQLTSVGDADIIGLAREGGQCCVQIFFYRMGQHYGNRAFFPAHTADASDGEILASIIGQFYANHTAPKLLLVSHDPESPEALTDALSSKESYKVSILRPVKGEKAKAVAFATDNAKEALQRHLSDSSTQANLLQGVQKLFDLPDVPERIEVYDNSHIMGSHALGAMIVATKEGFDTGSYRRFNIQKAAPTNQSGNVTGGDDFAMMREVMERRFKPGWEEGAIPDLLLIDGGKGQLSVVLETLAQLAVTVPVVGISKGPDRNAGREQFHQPGKEVFSLPHHDPTLHYLQRLRDEAHRFAIGGHRKKRAKALVTSVLDEVPGIGAKRKRALLNHFGAARGVQEATIEDLMSIDGISRQIAEAIYQHFHPDT